MRYIIPILLAAVLLTAAAACESDGEPGAEAEVESESGAASNDNPSEGVPTLVDLGSNSCVPCQQMEGELEELDAVTGNALEVTVIDVNRNRSAASEYGIRLIPTQVFLSEDGEELYRHEGFMSCDDMLARWERLGYSFNGEE